jgi:hypothetical protein
MLFLVMALFLAFNAAAQLAMQKSTANGVTVAVTPGKFAAGAKTLDFAVVLETHSQELSDDLVKSAVLVDDRGNEVKPLAWDGAAPGGHHRSGVLRFPAMEPRPQALELRISRPGEAKARTFRWKLQ